MLAIDLDHFSRFSRADARKPTPAGEKIDFARELTGR